MDIQDKKDAVRYLRSLPFPVPFNVLADVWNAAIDVAAEDFVMNEGTDCGITEKYTIEESDYE